MEISYFRDILFDLVNEWDQNVLEIIESRERNQLWVVMQDGSVFRISYEKEPFHLFRPPR